MRYLVVYHPTRTKKKFLTSVELGETSCFPIRVLLIYLFPAKEVTSLGAVLTHSEGDIFLDAPTISMVMEAFPYVSSTKTLNNALSIVSPFDGDWRKHNFLRDFCKIANGNDCGQAKILFSTLLPLTAIDDTNARVLVIGSGGSGGGGASYEIAANVLTMEDKFAEFFLYDKFEIKETKKIGNVIINGFDKYFVKGDRGTDSGILIDDSYVQGSISYLDIDMPATVYSLKSFGSGVVQPNYNGSERRIYKGCSLSLEPMKLPGMDNCCNCVLWGKLCSMFQFSTAEYIWHSAIRLGVVPCSSYDGTKLAQQTGMFESHVRTVKRFKLDDNETIDVGYLGISAAINMRAGRMHAHKNQLSWCQSQYSVINAFRTRVSSIKPRPSFEIVYDLTSLLIPDVTIAVVALNPSEYFPHDIDFVAPECAKMIFTSNIQILDELAPTYLLFQCESVRVIDGYVVDECKKIEGQYFCRFKRKVIRRKSYVKKIVTWDMVENKCVPRDALNLVVTSISNMLSGVPIPLAGYVFPKTRDELIFGLTNVLDQQASGLGPRSVNCGEAGCICAIMGEKKPWHVSCLDRSSKFSLCGFTPCRCRVLGPKLPIHYSCVNRAVKPICGMIGCRCLYLGPNIDFVVCNRRKR